MKVDKFKKLSRDQLHLYQGGKWVVDKIMGCDENGDTHVIMHQDSGLMRWLSGNEWKEVKDGK